MLPVSLQPPSHPPPLPSFEVVIANRDGMEWESSIASGSRLNYKLTTMPSTVGTIPLTTCLVTTCLLELYEECVDKGVWVRVLYEARDGIEKLTFLCKTMPPCQPGR
jgi:hypothetical protein